MKCVECKKEIDTGKHEIPPQWFGAYQGSVMLAVICAECIADQEKHKRWQDGADWKPKE